MISIYQAKDHRWRDSFNPLRGLTMGRLVSLLEAGERGQYADLQWFYYYMERSDAMIASAIQRRRSALLSVDWDIRVAAGSDDRKTEIGKAENRNNLTAENTEVTERERVHREDTKGKKGNGKKVDSVLAAEQAEFLRYAYDQIENFKDATGFLWSGVFRGFAHLEKHFSETGLIDRLEPVEQWFWVRDGMFGEWEYNRNANPGLLRGEPIERENFVVFETVALNRILAMLYLRKNLSQKDWDSYLEVFGIPSVFLVGPPNAGKEIEAEYQRIAEQIISDGRGYLPNGSDIKYVSGGGGKAPFMEHIEYLDKQITIAATGGLLTMLAEAGSGTLAGGAHSETFMQIARGDAVVLSGLLQREIDLPLLNAFFPGQPVQAYFEFSPVVSEQTRQVVQDAVDLSKAGLQVDAAEVAEKTGYSLDETDQPSRKATA